MGRTIAGLGLGGAAGILASFGGMPLPWLLGPLLACAALALAGFDLNQPVLLRKVGQMVAAIAIGLTFSPEVVATLSGYLPIMVLAAGASMLGALAVARVTSTFARTSFETAYFSSLPGGVAEMSVLAERYGGETALVALAQSLRIIIVVLTIPPLIVAFVGNADFSTGAQGAGDVFVPALAAMLVLGFALAFLFDRYKVMNAWFLAGLVVGAIIAIGEIPASSVPVEIVDIAQILIGCALGARINRAVLVKLRRFLPATISGTLGMIIFNAGIACLITFLAGLDLAGMLLATAPGGVAEMSITAKALHLAVPTVAAFHLVRVIMIILLSAPLYRCTAWIRTRLGQRQAAE